MSLRVSLFCASLAILLSCATSSLVAADPPVRVHDDRLQIDLVCEQPTLVTPTGIAVDAAGDVYVIESNTHFPPGNYKGLKADRIVRLKNAGNADALKATTFYEGMKHTMNIAYHRPSDSFYVATRMEVFRLRDTDLDGKADEHTTIARLDTKGDYPHNGLSGFAIGYDGSLYFGFGENLGADYKLIGSDGTTLAGGGEGGNVYCCRLDGTKLRRVATGFWNPFHLCLDIYGNLFVVDNDPDSRPPCRLLHVVEGGDYGFRFRHGRKGTHPYTAWNGEVPGTLPMVAGTGEAPSGIIAYESDGLPDEYRGDLLSTSWGDHRIERYHLEPRGASYVSTMKPVVSGGDNFRPVGIACAPDGSLYISDWVDKSYNVHGKGRVWRLRLKELPKPTRTQHGADLVAELKSPDREWREAATWKLAQAEEGRKSLLEIAAKGATVRERAAAITAIATTPASLPVKELLASEKDENLRALIAAAPRGKDEPARAIDPEWLKSPLLAAALLRSPDCAIDEAARIAALASPDPFVRQATREGLLRLFRETKNVPAEQVAKLWSSAPAVERVLLLHATERPEARGAITEFLKQDDPEVRAMAAQWIGDDRLQEFVAQLDVAKVVHVPSQRLLEAVVTAQTMLSDPGSQRTGDELLTRIAIDARQAPAIRLLALRGIRPDFPGLLSKDLFAIARGDDPALQREAIRSLRERDGSGQAKRMIELARDEKLPVAARAEAILGVPPDNNENRAALAEWAEKGELPLAIEAIRVMRRSLEGKEIDSYFKWRERFRQSPGWLDVVTWAVKENAAPMPVIPSTRDLPAWVEYAKKGEPDIAAGERLFFNPRVASCYRCHQMEGRGGKVGPDLTMTGPALTVERLVESIVQPSREVAPQFTSWQLTLADGRQFLALLDREEVDGTQIYLTPEGKEFRVKPADIEDRRPSQKSLMPDGLAATLTPDEFRDLIAFLNHKRQASKTP